MQHALLHSTRKLAPTHVWTFRTLSAVTCASRHSRNRAVGERLGQGESLEQIMGSMKQVAEGIWNAKAARDLARQHHVEMPITDEVCAIVEDGKDPRQALKDLMSRDPKAE